MPIVKTVRLLLTMVAGICAVEVGAQFDVEAFHLLSSKLWFVGSLRGFAGLLIFFAGMSVATWAVLELRETLGKPCKDESANGVLRVVVPIILLVLGTSLIVGANVLLRGTFGASSVWWWVINYFAGFALACGVIRICNHIDDMD